MFEVARIANVFFVYFRDLARIHRFQLLHNCANLLQNNVALRCMPFPPLNFASLFVENFFKKTIKARGLAIIGKMAMPLIPPSSFFMSKHSDVWSLLKSSNSSEHLQF